MTLAVERCDPSHLRSLNSWRQTWRASGLLVAVHEDRIPVDSPDPAQRAHLGVTSHESRAARSEPWTGVKVAAIAARSLSPSAVRSPSVTGSGAKESVAVTVGMASRLRKW